uniref:Uncharacterized protein n=1 Tax=Corvus moneduloides TaxID=1196302 RepID=A0A8C3DQH8_CORMO
MSTRAGSQNSITHLCRHPFLCSPSTAATGERCPGRGPAAPLPALPVLSPRRQPPAHPRFRTTNQSYGSRAPTVHELPSSFNILSHKFSDHLGKIGMVRNDGLNTSLEKSHCTGPDTFITAYEHLDFHPSYNPSGPSHCRDQPL